MFVEWSNVGRRKGYARVRAGATDSKFTFPCEKLDDLQFRDMWIGAKTVKGEKALYGELAALEVYRGSGKANLPQGIRDMIIQDQLMFPSSRKRKASIS